jgi:hypothetical protein
LCATNASSVYAPSRKVVKKPVNRKSGPEVPARKNTKMSCKTMKPSTAGIIPSPMLLTNASNSADMKMKFADELLEMSWGRNWFAMTVEVI